MQGESSIDFAGRVKHEIAKKGGLVELLWDGNLKRNKVNPSQRDVNTSIKLNNTMSQVKSEWKVAAQQEFVRRIKGGEREL